MLSRAYEGNGSASLDNLRNFLMRFG